MSMMMGEQPPGLGGLAAMLGGQAPPPGPQQGGEEGPIQILKKMLALADQYRSAEPDEGDKAVVAKIVPLLQQLLAKDQADRDKLLGGAGAAMRRLGRGGQ